MTSEHDDDHAATPHGHAHGAAHRHAHGHAHGHDHVGAGHDFGRAFIIGIVLNAGFVVLELVYGFAAHSTALVADAVHNAADVGSLVLAWVASRLAQRAPDARFTYGLRSTTILAALANAVLLLLACGGLAW